jgi:hypothetical protein
MDSAESNRVVALQAELKSAWATNRAIDKARIEDREKFEKQLLVAQAEVKRLRGVLDGLQYCIDPDMAEGYQSTVDEISEALSTPSDTSAIDALQRDAERLEAERIAHLDTGNTLGRKCQELFEELSACKPNSDRYLWILHQAKITDFIFAYLKSDERHVSNAIDAAIGASHDYHHS